MQQAIQRLSSEEIEDMPDDKKAQALSMLNYIQDDYEALNNASEDDSLFDPECVDSARYTGSTPLTFCPLQISGRSQICGCSLLSIAVNPNFANSLSRDTQLDSHHHACLIGGATNESYSCSWLTHHSGSRSVVGGT